jgi:hypothetical protein
MCRCVYNIRIVLYIAYNHLIFSCQCLMKESDLVRRSTWSSVWHIAHRARFSRERNRRVIHAAHWQACRKQRHSPTHNYFSKPEETRGWESRHYSVGSPRYFFFFLIWAILCHQAKYPKWHHSYNMMATIVQQVPLSFRIGEASLPIENARFFFFFLNQFIFRHTVPRTSPVVATNHYI